MATERMGRCRVTRSDNNTHVVFRFRPRGSSTVTPGRVQRSTSTGRSGFKGSKRGTAHAAEVSRSHLAREVKRHVDARHVVYKGVGQGRTVVLKALSHASRAIRSVTDATPMPYNGCRPKKARRV